MIIVLLDFSILHQWRMLAFCDEFTRFQSYNATERLMSSPFHRNKISLTIKQQNFDTSLSHYKGFIEN